MNNLDALIKFLKSHGKMVTVSAVHPGARFGELMAYKHDGFWQCMDTKRDRDMLESLWLHGSALWKV